MNPIGVVDLFIRLLPKWQNEVILYWSVIIRSSIKYSYLITTAPLYRSVRRDVDPNSPSLDPEKHNVQNIMRHYFQYVPPPIIHQTLWYTSASMHYQGHFHTDNNSISTYQLHISMNIYCVHILYTRIWLRQRIVPNKRIIAAMYLSNVTTKLTCLYFTTYYETLWFRNEQINCSTLIQIYKRDIWISPNNPAVKL